MSDDEQGWTTVTKVRKNYSTRSSEFVEEEEDPCMSLQEAWRLEEIHRVSGLHTALTSDHSREIQKNGYHFVKVLKKDDPNYYKYLDDANCQILEIGNKWKDVALFERK